MPFLPLHDKNPRIRIDKPWVTWALILACCAVFLAESQLHPRQLEQLVFGLGIVPATLLGDRALVPDLFLVPPILTLFTSLFLHGDLMHLIGNMAYLWVFGDNIEDSMGHVRFLGFYLLCGVAAGLAQAAADPAAVTPTIGASGAISGVLGSYLILHPKARILVPIIIIPLYLPAYLLLIFWIGFQLFSAAAAGVDSGAVAWWAHIGGFVAGMALIIIFRHKTIPLFGGDLYPKGLKMAVYDHRPERRRSGQQDAGSRPRRGPWEK